MGLMSIQLPTGILIAVEGIDGAGKTTQARALRDRLQAAGLDVLLTKEPTDGPWGRKLRASAQDGRLSPAEELEAFLEDRREHVQLELAPALAAGKVVIVDRYYFSSAAYQGARGMSPEAILAENEAFAPQPDLLVLLDVPAAAGVARIRARGDKENLFEHEELLQRSGEIFRAIDRPYLLVVDGLQPPEEITNQVLARLRLGPLFDRLCPKRDELEACDPPFCRFRMAGQCRWGKLGSLASPVAPGPLDLARQLAHDDSVPAEEKVRRLLEGMGAR